MKVKFSAKKLPAKELADLYFAVADMVDGSNCEDLIVIKAYEAVFATAWGRKLYNDAVEMANARLK